jgi:hypothetical protein
MPASGYFREETLILKRDQGLRPSFADRLRVFKRGNQPPRKELFFPYLPVFHPFRPNSGLSFPRAEAPIPRVLTTDDPQAPCRASSAASEAVVPFSRHISIDAGTTPARAMRSPSLIMIAQKRISPKISQ